jgi:hypothetical protein
MKGAIFLQPAKTAEFIIIDFNTSNRSCFSWIEFRIVYIYNKLEKLDGRITWLDRDILYGVWT